MDLAELLARQRHFDARHGWDVSSRQPRELASAIAKDIIGLVGEIGEFANLLKKIQLLESRPEDFDREWRASEPAFAEEIIDAFIYLMRIVSHLDIDLEARYLEKVSKNEERFRKFEG